MSCSYWNGTSWATDGCQFSEIESNKVKCLCNHLTAFGPQFITPPAFTNVDTQDPSIQKALPY